MDIRIHLQPLRAVARTTAIELASQPVVLLLLLTGCVMTSLIPLLHFHDFGEPGRLVRDGGLAYQLVIGTILAVFYVSRTIHDELGDGTALPALAKPISRGAFLAGKWLGAMSVIFSFWLATLATTIVAFRVSPRFVDLGEEGMGFVTDSTAQSILLLVPAISLVAAGYLHNRRRVRFCLAAVSLVEWLSITALAITLLFDRQWHFAPSLSNANLVTVLASLPILFAVASVSAIAAALSVRLPAAPVMAITAILVAAGLSWDSICASWPLLAALPVPDIQDFWLPDMLSRQGTIPARYLAMSFAYALSIALFALVCGTAALESRDVN